MAVTAKVYSNAPKSFTGKLIDFDSDTIKVALLTNAYTPNQNTHDFLDDVIANETSGTGYTAGGATLGSCTITTSTTTTTLDAADAAWTGGSFTYRYAIVYDATPATNATRPLIAYVDAGADQVVSGNHSIVWNASGICTFTVS